MRSRPFQSSNRRTQSLANPTIYTGGEEKAPPTDHRGKTNKQGKQGTGICAHCGAEVSLRKVSRANPARNGDITAPGPVAGSHREGGGGYSARRGDVLCKGAGVYARAGS